MVEREDVVAAYRAILGRDPENEQAFAFHCRHASAADLINTLAGSDEARDRVRQRTAPPRLVNGFVYERCSSAGISPPDIPVFLTEQYGQCAEDLIVSALLEGWSRRQGFDLADATYLEIGGNHPIATSASFLLSRIHAMKGVIVEANPELIPALRALRGRDVCLFGAMQAQDVETVTLSVAKKSELSSLDPDFVKNFAGGSIGERHQIEVPALRINAVLEAHFTGTGPHFLSIDIEGLDLPVLRDLDFKRFRPLIIQAEPSDHHLPGNTDDMIQFLDSQGYLLMAMTAVNCIFMAREAL